MGGSQSSKKQTPQIQERPPSEPAREPVEDEKEEEDKKEEMPEEVVKRPKQMGQMGPMSMGFGGDLLQEMKIRQSQRTSEMSNPDAQSQRESKITNSGSESKRSSQVLTNRLSQSRVSTNRLSSGQLSTNRLSSGQVSTNRLSSSSKTSDRLSKSSLLSDSSSLAVSGSNKDLLTNMARSEGPGDHVESEDAVPELPAIPQLQHLAKNRPKRNKKHAATKSMVLRDNPPIEGAMDDIAAGMEHF